MRAKNGAKLVVIDPVFTGSAAKADLYVSPRPGSDAALALGMMHIVLEKGWQDEAFLRDNTVAPFLCKEEGGHLRAADIGMDASGIAEADLSKKSIIVAKSEDGVRHGRRCGRSAARGPFRDQRHQVRHRLHSPT